jgi:hypothetical protein
MRMVMSRSAAMLAVAGVLMMGRAIVPVDARAGDVAVTVTFKGKGPVDAKHEIWVFLFDSPNIGQGSTPVAVQAVTKSGGTATFKNVTQDLVYVAVAYDEKGDYDGNSGPPPQGAPVAVHTVDGKAGAPVTPGPKGIVKLTFDDSQRMGQQ